MQIAVTIDGVGKVTLTDRDYVASGGEASVYSKSNLACKIYHDPKRMISLNKIAELQKIKDARVLKPLHIIYDKDGKEIGYAMEFKSNTEPICKFFTKAFKIKNNISNDQLNILIEKGQEIVKNIHNAKCLVVDLNELNVIVPQTFDDLYFIDVDSYQTPGSHATAIMESIKDPLVKNNQWTENSDWFSFAVVEFQSFTNIHPFKGKHPKYRPDEWIKRMEDGISVFDKDVSLPKVCEDFSVIPGSHLVWMKDLFVNKKRYPPPVISSVHGTVSVPDQFRFISSNVNFEGGIEEEFDEVIKDVFVYTGIAYYIGNKHIYRGKSVLSNDITNCKSVFICNTSDINPVICKYKNGQLLAENMDGENIHTINVDGVMSRNGCLYVTQDDRLIECVYRRFGTNTVGSVQIVATINPLSTLLSDGVAFHTLLGKAFMILPYEIGTCINIPVPEMDGYRIIDGCSEKNVVVAIAEKRNKYYRFVFQFNRDYTSYEVRVNDNISYSETNLTVMPNGVGIIGGTDNVEIFKDKSVKVVDNPPFNSSTKLFNIGGKLMYIDGKKVYWTKIKPK